MLLLNEKNTDLKRQEADDIQRKTITDTENADEPALIVNTPAQAESLLHSLKQTARGTGL